MSTGPVDPERQRLAEADAGAKSWRRWGTYLADRQWGTVREDYSPDGAAWEYVPHDHARSRAYRWGEDGIAGFGDDRLRLCLALALWNGHDPILKERLFGLSNHEGNHGEDVKEWYVHLDATPTYSYAKMLYRYPQSEFPYARLVEENRRRGLADRELELVDTGAFDGGRYFDVVVEYAKADPEDVLMRISATNRAPAAAELHLLPQLWFRNTWAFDPGTPRPRLRRGASTELHRLVEAAHPELGPRSLACQGAPELLFCDNETNAARLFGASGGPAYPKDAVNARVVEDRADAVNPAGVGTKVAAWYRATIPAGGTVVLRLRLVREPAADPFAGFDELVERRRAEADEFYAVLQDRLEDEDARMVQRRALAGLLWSEQLYCFDVGRWLAGDPAEPAPPPERRSGRNAGWRHVDADDVLVMPDSWEYPWFASWDTAFHCVPLALVDPELAKRQLVLLTREWYMHPNGQLPAYEWEFSDVNPPVEAWAAWRVFQIDRRRRGDAGDLGFLERILHKLMLNFTWWVNREDPEGRNLFEGGFLGLDNVGVFDRSKPLPTGGHVHQSDATSWMAMYALNLMRIALELALENPVYQDIATKFFEHFLAIADAMANRSAEGVGLWDEQDGFFYDVLHLPDGRLEVLRIRSVVGLIPLFAVEILEPELLARVPQFRERLEWVLANRPALAALVSRWDEPGRGERRLLSLLRGHRMKCLLHRMLDEEEFLSPNGVRSLSRVHLERPYTFASDGATATVRYSPAESDVPMFGGNSNWRGPVWLPVNFLAVESLQRFHHYYGDEFKVECPTGSGRFVTLLEVADDLSARLAALFLRGRDGRRPVLGDDERLQSDPTFAGHPLFYEYFDGDTGRGLGASHQTGWTALVAKLLQPRRPPR